ncbi:hypothetical protein BIWAKO_06280 [Bosea sp. BIWAKO-01]|nr:hypothetical protein BIWAKO_06280 [Bosea sp. BIWAKO-01]
MNMSETPRDGGREVRLIRTFPAPSGFPASAMGGANLTGAAMARRAPRQDRHRSPAKAVRRS